MPIYIELTNLLIPKSTVKFIYPGGLNQFRKDYRTQEDHHLISLSAMNVDELDFPFDEGDYTIINRYGGAGNVPDWFRSNGIFTWHKDTPAELIEKANKIANAGVDEILQSIEKGASLLTTF